VLLGDEKKLRRIIMNLVDNAIKFTESGGVCLWIGYRKESYGINLVVSVKDTGIGMDAVSLEKLFTSFSQVDASRTRQEGGLGLGLAICHALVEKMGGAITVKSKPQKGTVVKVVIPQKVLDEKPIAALSHRSNINVATYIDMEQFNLPEIRDDYTAMIMHMVEQLKGRCHVCRNLAELQRRNAQDNFSHIFISMAEYKQNTAYFEQLAEETNVVVVLERSEERFISNRNILKVYKPFYILTIVAVLNGVFDRKDGNQNISVQKFVTKDAHVLVVDDNRMNLRVVEELLAYYRIKVTTASSGKEALDKIVTVDYDFIFMDHMMPEMDGVETLKNIRHMVGTYYQKVPIVALTANAVAGTREMLLAEGFNDFLEKPIERSVLERVLKRNLPKDKIVPVDELEEEDVQNTDSELIIEELDVEKGILYCNGKEQYISILRGYCEDWNQSGDLADQLFEKRDWKNYTIAVHGMKSAMRSIGATQLSEQARLLEYAGKDGRIDFILQNHNDLMNAYRRLFEKLKKNEQICPNQVEERVETPTIVDIYAMPVISSDALDRIIEQMEDVSYSLDGEKLLELISELEKYQYKGQALKEVLVPIRRKVESYDYVSAVENMMRWKNGLPK
jgi:CheY-like chemotaxis protein